MPAALVEREGFDKIAAHLQEPEITVLTGARQTGKTTLLSQLKDWLLTHRKAGESQI